MEFWSQHGLVFLIGMLLWPRMMMIYYGSIPPQSISSILEFALIPRIFLASILTPIYYDTNPTMISIYWILAVIMDVMSIIFKFKMQVMMMQQFSFMKERMERGLSPFGS
jgi:hypothetical protein